MQHHQHGYVALIAVLIVGAAATAIASTLLMTGVDSQRAATIDQRSVQARTLADACAEEALQQIYADTNFTGTNNLSMGQGTCAYTVANAGGSNRTITASGTVNNVVRRLQISATIGGSSISITSWQEVI